MGGNIYTSFPHIVTWSWLYSSGTGGDASNEGIAKIEKSKPFTPEGHEGTQRRSGDLVIAVIG